MNNTERLKSTWPFWVALVFIVGWTVVLFYFSPKELVEAMGVGNSYLMAFLISVVGAFSSFTTFSAYPAVITLAAGRVDPFILGGVAGLGLAIGDTFFYFFGMTARGVASRKFQDRVHRWLQWLKKRSDFVIQCFIFFYVGFTPFPNNILTGLLAIDRYPFKKVVVPLVLGDMVLPIVAAYLSYKGVDLFFNQDDPLSTAGF